MINPSDLVRSVSRYLGEVPDLAGYTVVRRFSPKKIVDRPTIHVYLGTIEAGSATAPRLGTDNWLYPVTIDCYVPQPRAEEYEDRPAAAAAVAIGEALSSQIRIYDYDSTERQTGTFVMASGIKIDLGTNPAVRIEVALELS